MAGPESEEHEDVLPSSLYDAINYSSFIDVLHRMIENDPKQLTTWNKQGPLPLHFALEVLLQRIGCDPIDVEELETIDPFDTVVRCLVEKYPEGFRVKDNNGCLPLHFAAYYAGLCESNVKIFRFLVEQFPEGVREKDNKGCLPLHIAAQRPELVASFDIIRLLSEQYPEGVRDKDMHGQLALHHASKILHTESCAQIVRFLLHLYAEGVREKDNDGQLPLHIAASTAAATDPEPWVSYEVVYDTIEVLVTQYPEGLRVKNNDGHLPLHMTVHRDHVNRESIVYLNLLLQLLVDKFPESVREKDHDGCLPLHLAAQNKYIPMDIVLFLIDQFPEGIREKDNRGSLPLHHVFFHAHICYDLRSSLVPFLVGRFPESIQVKDNDGYLPLHRAVSCKIVSLRVIRYLVYRFPESVRETTLDHGFLPLHLAVGKVDTPRESESSSSFEISRFLIEEFPESVHVSDHDGYLPLHRAVVMSHSNASSLSLVMFLVERFPQGLRAKTFDNHHANLPLHCAIESIISSSSSCRSYRPAHMVRFLMEQYPFSTEEPAQDGSLPLFLIAGATAFTHPSLSKHYLELIYACLLHYPNFLFRVVEDEERKQQTHSTNAAKRTRYDIRSWLDSFVWRKRRRWR